MTCISDGDERTCNPSGVAEEFDFMLDAITVLIRELGEDSSREGLQRTPLRVSKALKFATSGPSRSAEEIIGNAVFTEKPAMSGSLQGQGGGQGGMVTVRDVNLFSCCKGCLLPLKMRCHLAYIPAMHRVVGLSKLPRIGVACSRCLQSPSDFAKQLANSVFHSFRPLGVAVLVESWHLGIPPQANGKNGVSNGPKSRKDSFGWQRVTENGKKSWGVGLGEFEGAENELWEEFLAILGRAPGSSCQLSASENAASCSDPVKYCEAIGGFCRPLWSLEKDPRQESWAKLLSAAQTIVKSVAGSGDFQLEGTAEGYVRQLMAATAGLWLSLEGVLEEICEGQLAQEHGREAGASQNGATSDGRCLTSNGPSGAPEPTLRRFESLSLSSLCEHHLLPFFGHVHVGCSAPSFEGFEVLREHLEKIVHLYGRRPQVQERLTRQIAEATVALMRRLGEASQGSGEGVQASLEDPCFGVIVVIQASHLCVASRGVEKTRSSTVTVATLGCYATSSRMRSAFLGSLPSGDFDTF